MNKIYTSILFLLLNTVFVFSQNTTCNCCTSEYSQFDFWVGNWEVYNKKGEKVGENAILKMQDNCVIQENWVSKGQTGTSYNFYNKLDQSWNQVYIDSFGTVLELKGSLINNEMVLESKKIKSTKADFHYFNRITWSKQENGDVRQKWEIIGEDNKVIQVAFDGIYKRK
jgi:hypothetical protein